MAPQVKKPTRRDRAQATRSRMLDSAEELFARHGYAGTRMADVAAQAGVAVQTVYFSFHTKAELLKACIDRAVMGPDDPAIPQEQPFWPAMMEAGSGPEAIGHFVDGVAAISARVARLNLVAASARHEPDAFAIWTRSEELRRAGFRQVVEHLESSFGLRGDLDVASATDLLLTVAGHGPYCDLVHACGWSHEEYSEWLARTLCEMLLPR